MSKAFMSKQAGKLAPWLIFIRRTSRAPLIVDVVTEQCCHRQVLQGEKSPKHRH